MVRLGSHQEAMIISTKFRLLGQTHQTNVLLRRNLAAVSGARAAHFQLHPDGVARAVDDCGEGEYPIEEIRNERSGKDGRTEFEVVYAGDWPDHEKFVWEDESRCNPADIANFRYEQRVKACESSDMANGITAHNTQPATRHTLSRVATGRVQKAHSGRRSNTKPRLDRISKTRVAATKPVLTESDDR